MRVSDVTWSNMIVASASARDKPVRNYTGQLTIIKMSVIDSGAQTALEFNDEPLYYYPVNNCGNESLQRDESKPSFQVNTPIGYQ